jgi:sugar/nucleoside kinase (ribokinase family)
VSDLSYLSVGHVTEDVWPDRPSTAGGTAMYSARCAHALGAHTRVLTAAADTLDIATIFPGINVARVDSPVTTQFWNVYAAGRRTQYTRPNPVRLQASHLTPELAASSIIHLAPVCDEIEPGFVGALPRSAFVGVTPQGFLRRWDSEGRVSQAAHNWTHARAILARANAVVMSIEDIEGDWQTAHKWAAQTRVLIVTTGPEGCVVLRDGGEIRVPAPTVEQVDPTGAGDVFAATLFVALQQGADIEEACARANCIASTSVTRPNMQGLPTPADVRRCFGGPIQA